MGTKDALWSELPKSEHINEKKKKDRSGLSEEGKRENKNSVFPHIVSAETILFLIWKSKGHST